MKKFVCRAIGFLILTLVAGCATPKFAPVDLAEPGWQVTQTQAAWRPGKDAPEITGDLILATNHTGRSFISFSKTLPLITAQSGKEGWKIEAPENRQFAAPGKPSNRIIWFQIVPAKNGEKLRKPWMMEKSSTDTLKIFHAKTGEQLELF